MSGWDNNKLELRTVKTFIPAEILACIEAEYEYIETRFPGNKQNLAALMEEVGEHAQALIDSDRGKQTFADAFAEAIQVAAMGIKMAHKGSQEFDYVYKPEYAEAFDKTKTSRYLESLKTVVDVGC